MNRTKQEVENMLNLIAETLYQVVGDDTAQLDAKLGKLKLELKKRVLRFAEKKA
jgi:tRNA threonylcarbamoyladenosine modification (KEOPS) complex  Pcc1 subunit